MAQAKKLFLTYDQKELIKRCRLQYDDVYFYVRFMGEQCRICRVSGDMERFCKGQWIDSNSFEAVMTILDWLCDSKENRYITGNWINIVSHGHYFHSNLQEGGDDPNARYFEENEKAFMNACEKLGGEKQASADIAYTIELVDGLKILVQLWHGDEEFPPKVRLLWDENTLRYIRYETTWYAAGLLLERIKENMK